MSDMSFTWKGQSSDDLGIVVKSLPPIYTPAARDETITIPGRSGALHISDGAYEEQLMTIEGYLPYEQGGYVAEIESIKNWLMGNGDLGLSDRPDRVYHARITDAITFSPFVIGFSDRVFSVPFWTEPFAYEAEPSVFTLRHPTTLFGEGTVSAEPEITVNGTGDISLTVGDTTLTLTGIVSGITIDCARKIAYNGTTSLSHKVAGEWPKLKAGETTAISWTGNVTSVVITPNWRWL